MSEKKIKKEFVTYDYTKNITGLEINPSYIVGLQNILATFMLNASEENKLKIPDATKKFKTIMEFDPKDGGNPPNVEFDEYEQSLYVLFSLINYFKYQADIQKISLTKEIEVDEDFMQSANDVIKSGIKNGNLVEELTRLGDKFSNLKDVLENSAKE